MAVFMIIGLPGFFQNDPYNVFKDLWYTANPVLALITGYMLMRRIKDLGSLFRILILAAVAISLFHILQFATKSNLHTESFVIIRCVAGKGYFLTVLAIPIIVTCRRANLILFPRFFVTFAFVTCSVSFFLSFSRTLWMSLALMLLAGYGLLTVRSLKKIVVLSLLVAGFLFFILFSLKAELIPDIGLRAKMVRSLEEVMIRDYFTMEDMHRNWRGFESFRAMQTYLEGTAIQHITGRGFGTLVDLGIYMNLGGLDFRYIPILHNGYLFILVKTGLAGLLIYFYFFIKLISHGRRCERASSSDSSLAGNLIVALSIVILATTFVIAGFFNKSTLLPAIMLLGALVGFTDQDRKQSALAEGS